MSTDVSSQKVATNRRTLGEWLNIDGISYIPSTVLLTGISKVSLKDNHLFAVLDRKGESPRVYRAELGFYLSDTRHLSHWEMSVNGEPLVYLSHELRGQGNSCVFSLVNRDIPTIDRQARIQRDTLLIRRVLTLSRDTIFEHLELTNYDVVDHQLEITQHFGSSFDDIFEVRGMSRRRRGELLPPAWEAGRLTFAYRGLDGVTRSTVLERIGAKPEVELLEQSATLISRIVVPGKGRTDLKTILSLNTSSDGLLFGERFELLTVTEHLKLVEDLKELAYLGPIKLRSDDALFDRAMLNARVDIEMLTTMEPALELVYPYAGVPWFAAPFGRDGLIAAYQTLPFYPRLSAGVLDFVFRTIGTKVDAFTDEEPGKIFHELRRGEMANLREIPYIPYYGSVDSTPLALILLSEYVAWTGDLEKARQWWPQARAALAWLDDWGDADGDGFIEYSKRSPTGLDNQGWKDSHNSIMYEDGVLAAPPIQLCEVQAYAYRARTGMARLASLLGDHDLAALLLRQAGELRASFTEAFWDAREGYVYLARDGAKRPCKVMSSNQGHCLWGQILDERHARLVADHLMSPRLFSGYGIRTLAADEKSFNPLSYHNGSIWPHDNSLIAEGFRFYNQLGHLQRLADAMIDVATISEDFRLPELYCGFRRRHNEGPIPYEVACRPQAWAAGSLFLLLKSLLGMVMVPGQNEIVFQTPLLPSKVSSIQLDDLRVQDTEFSVLVSRGKSAVNLEIPRRSGPMRILVQK